MHLNKLKTFLILGVLSVGINACSGGSGIKLFEPAISDSPLERYFIFNDEKRFGFMDKQGQIVIKPQFINVGNFSQGLAAVEVLTDKEQKRWGYINHKGEFAIEPQYLNAEDFSEEHLARVSKFEKNKGLSWVFINRRGKEEVKIPQGYISVGGFHHKFAPIQKLSSQKKGFINTKGEVVIEAKFDKVGAFNEGLAPVKIGTGLNSLAGYIDASGELMIKPKFDDAIGFSDGRAVISTNIFGVYSIIDKAGVPIKEQIQPGCNVLQGFSEGLLSVSLPEGQRGFMFASLCGYLDSTGKVVIPPRFQDAQAFSEGLANVKVKNKWGYINREGQMIIEPRFDNPRPFQNGLALVSENPMIPFGYINQKGEYVWKSVNF